MGPLIGPDSTDPINMAQRTLLVCLLPILFSFIAVRAIAIESHSVHLKPDEVFELKNPGCFMHYAAIGEQFKTAPNAIIKHEVLALEGKVFDVERLGKAIQIYEPRAGAKLPDLADGTYVYAVDKKKNRLVMINRILDPGAEAMRDPKATFLGSHEGIRTYLEHIDGEPVYFVAAGEVFVRNGQIFAFSNGAGTYRGKSSSFLYAYERFKELGLKLTSKTQLRNHAIQNLEDPHGAEGRAVAQQARVALEASRNPDFVELLAYARTVMRKTSERFPVPREAILAAMALRTKEEFATMQSIFRVFGYWLKPQENEVWALANAYNEPGGAEKTRRALELLDEVARNAKPNLGTAAAGAR